MRARIPTCSLAARIAAQVRPALLWCKSQCHDVSAARLGCIREAPPRLASKTTAFKGSFRGPPRPRALLCHLFRAFETRLDGGHHVATRRRGNAAIEVTTLSVFGRLVMGQTSECYGGRTKLPAHRTGCAWHLNKPLRGHSPFHHLIGYQGVRPPGAKHFLCSCHWARAASATQRCVASNHHQSASDHPFACMWHE